MGGVEKIFGKHRSILPRLWEGKPKKRSSSWPFTFFWGTSLAQGGTFIAWRGAADSTIADLASCPQIQGEDQKNKKRSLVRNYGLSLGVHSCFSSRIETSLTLGGTSSVLGAQAPKCNQLALSLLLSFGALSSLGGQFLVWGGTSSDLGGTAPKCPPWRRATILYNTL